MARRLIGYVSGYGHGHRRPPPMAELNRRGIATPHVPSLQLYFSTSYIQALSVRLWRRTAPVAFGFTPIQNSHLLNQPLGYTSVRE